MSPNGHPSWITRTEESYEATHRSPLGFAEVRDTLSRRNQKFMQRPVDEATFYSGTLGKVSRGFF